MTTNIIYKLRKTYFQKIDITDSAKNTSFFRLLKNATERKGLAMLALCFIVAETPQ